MAVGESPPNNTSQKGPLPLPSRFVLGLANCSRRPRGSLTAHAAASHGASLPDSTPAPGFRLPPECCLLLVKDQQHSLSALPVTLISQLSNDPSDTHTYAHSPPRLSTSRLLSGHSPTDRSVHGIYTNVLLLCLSLSLSPTAGPARYLPDQCRRAAQFRAGPARRGAFTCSLRLTQPALGPGLFCLCLSPT